MMNYKLKSFIQFLILLTLPFIGQAQETKIGLELFFHLESVEANEMVPLLAEGDENELKGEVERLGGHVRLQLGKLYSLEIPSNQVINFSKSDALERIEFSKAPAHFMSDTMLIQTRANLVHQMSSPLRKKYNGKGVVLGVIDSGIELDHPDFQDSLGNTRILYVWDQRVAYDPNRKPGNYTYGVEWDSTSINNNSSTHDDNPAEFGHGSMVTGAAASNANATGNFKGVAPEVNIISVATDFSANNWLQTVAEAVDYIYSKADSLGMPCVINASIGTYLGSHDGEDIAARMIDQLIKAKNGRALVAAAGNAGQFNFHLQHQANQDTVFSWIEYEAALYGGQGGVYYQMWGDTADMKDLKFAFGADRIAGGNYEFRGRTAFDSIQNRLNVVYLDSIMSHSNQLLAYVYTYAEVSQGRYFMEVAMPQPDSNQYRFRLESAGQGKIDIWSALNITGTSDIIRNNLPTVQQFPPIQKYVRSDSLQSMVSSFTCLPSVITVGNYINRSTYIDVSGTARNVNVTPGEISPNSSLGPNRRGYLKPDISSAGDYMFSAGRLATMATVINSSPSRIAQDSMHMRNGGTSMAAPTVAGMVALYLQQCPNSDHAKIKNDLIQTRRLDAFSSSAPSPKWGNGKADAMAYLSQNVFQPPIIMPLPDYCDGDTAFITTNSYSSYSWSTGDTTAIVKITRTDSIYVEVNNGACSSVSDTVNIIFKPSPSKPSIIQRNDSLIIQQAGTFRWYFNNTLILGSFDSIHVATNTGSYHAELIGNNGCSAYSDTINYVATYLEETVTPTFLIFPNPTEEVLSIKAYESLHEIQLYDQNGRLLEQLRDLDQGQLFNLQMGHYEKGVYFLQLKTSNTVEREKIIKW